MGTETIEPTDLRITQVILHIRESVTEDKLISSVSDDVIPGRCTKNILEINGQKTGVSPKAEKIHAFILISHLGFRLFKNYFIRIIVNRKYSKKSYIFHVEKGRLYQCFASEKRTLKS